MFLSCLLCFMRFHSSLQSGNYLISHMKNTVTKWFPLKFILFRNWQCSIKYLSDIVIESWGLNILSCFSFYLTFHREVIGNTTWRPKWPSDLEAHDWLLFGCPGKLWLKLRRSDCWKNAQLGRTCAETKWQQGIQTPAVCWTEIGNCTLEK